jgi:hypothetical protein
VEKEEKGQRAAGLRGEERKEEEARPAGPCGRRRKGGLGLGCKGKKREEKEKGRVGRAQLEKEGEKQLHSNTFEFEFKI